MGADFYSRDALPASPGIFVWGGPEIQRGSGWPPDPRYPNKVTGSLHDYVSQADAVTGQVADTPTRGLDISRTSRLAD